MAFHLACPLSCRKICYCSFGGRDSRPLLQTSLQLEQITAALATVVRSSSAGFSSHVLPFDEGTTVDVVVPSLVKDVKKNKRRIPEGRQDGRENAEEGRSIAGKKAFRGSKIRFSSSIPVADTNGPNAERAKKTGGKFRVTRQPSNTNTGVKTFVVSGSSTRTDDELAGGVVGPVRHGPKVGPSGEDLLQPLLPRAVCGLCSSVDIMGRKKEERMLSCRGCDRKYHRKCVKKWAEFRDLFDWSSWLCSSCRICEVCRQTGDPNKLMFCKRCDSALHVYCQQPPLKHVPRGPYLCPKHTFCHSCASNVPGSGVSSKWFMSYTTCDACGRLFAKDKYCPVCLKVYRDSEATPMVRCDSCEHWVHCQCDGISDEKFNQFQNDDNLRYECAACRGDCVKVNSIDDAVRELWRRRDQSDAEQRVKQGLVSQDEVLDFYASSDDEKQPPFNDKQERETTIVQRNNLKRPRRKWIQNSQKKGEPRQKLLSSVVLQY